MGELAYTAGGGGMSELIRYARVTTINGEEGPWAYPISDEDAWPGSLVEMSEGMAKHLTFIAKERNKLTEELNREFRRAAIERGPEEGT